MGRSLAETVLDMSGQNPYSRLSHTEFKTVEGVKRSLINRLKLSPEFKSTTNLSPGQESPLKIGSLNPLDANGNPVLMIVAGTALGSKSNKKSTVLTPSQTGGGPLGPKNRENRNSTENAKPTSGSQAKTLPKKKQSSLGIPNDSSSSPAVATSSSSLNRAASLPKSKLTKIMKIKSFPRVSSAKPRTKTKKPSNLDLPK